MQVTRSQAFFEEYRAPVAVRSPVSGHVLTRTRLLIVAPEGFECCQVKELIAHRIAAVACARDIGSALQLLQSRSFDVVLATASLDLHDYVSLCHYVRNTLTLPIILLVETEAEEEILLDWLNLGADDFVVAPFSQAEILARLQVGIEHGMKAPESGQLELAEFDDGNLRISLETRTVTVQGKPVLLTPVEFKILAFLLQNQGLVVTHDQILEEIWGWDHGRSPAYLHTYVSRLRHKLEANPEHAVYFQTYHGVGYRLIKSSHPSSVRSSVPLHHRT